MISENEIDIPLSEIDVGDDGELVAPLTDDAEPVVVRMHPRDDGRLTVEVSDTASGRELYRRPQPADWYTKDQLVRTIKNKINEAHPADLEPPFMALAGLYDRHHDEITAVTLPPIVVDLLDQTEQVGIYAGGGDATFCVEMTKDRRTAELEFTAAEIGGENPTPFRTKYLGVFYEKMDLPPDVWTDLAEEWINMAEVVASERYGDREAIADEVVSRLKRRIEPVGDKSGLAVDPLNAWYDIGNTKDDPDVTDAHAPDADVLWIRTDAIREILKDLGEAKDYFSKLSPALVDNETAYATSKSVYVEGTRKRCIPFDPRPEGLDIPRGAVHDSDEPDTEVDPR